MPFTLQGLLELEDSVQLRQKVHFKGNLKCFIKLSAIFIANY